VITARYVRHPWPVNFLLIVDPLVTWIWVGAIIIAGGGLIALWPIPSLARRRRTATVPAQRPPAPPVAPPPPPREPVREPV
jgi:cytochrome c-type biogenesis protein CcmF